MTYAQPDSTYRAIEQLARIAAASERRVERLERLFHWTLALFALALALTVYALSQVFTAQPAQAQRGWPHEAPVMPSEAPAPALDAARPSGAVEAAFAARIEELRARLAQEPHDASDPGHVLAVVFHDIHGVLRDMRATFAVMPQMGDDMNHMRGDMSRIAATMGSMDQKMAGVPVMADEMRRLNVSMEIMTTSIDSTMGRMGRMMPYFW